MQEDIFAYSGVPESHSFAELPAATACVVAERSGKDDGPPGYVNRNEMAILQGSALPLTLTYPHAPGGDEPSAAHLTPTTRISSNL
jgi:hypothetical protein